MPWRSLLIIGPRADMRVDAGGAP